MIKALLKIRIKQFFRSLKYIGGFRVAFLIALAVIVAFYIFKFSEKPPFSYYLILINVIIIGAIQIKRGDQFFLKTHFDNYRTIFIVEYFILTVPSLFCLLFHYQWESSLILLAFLLPLSFVSISVKQRSLNSKIQQYIPDESFEWKAGIRKYLYSMVFIWSIGMGTSFFVGSVPVAIFLLGIIVSAFYESGEPLQILLAGEKGANKFLLRKMKLYVLQFTILVIPLIVLFIVFNLERWYIAVVVYSILISFHIYMILLKYAFYEPSQKSSASQSLLSLGFIAVMVPIFIPVLWIMSIWFYIKSNEKLSLYLDDFN